MNEHIPTERKKKRMNWKRREILIFLHRIEKSWATKKKIYAIKVRRKWKWAARISEPRDVQEKNVVGKRWRKMWKKFERKKHTRISENYVSSKMFVHFFGRSLEWFHRMRPLICDRLWWLKFAWNIQRLNKYWTHTTIVCRFQHIYWIKPTIKTNDRNVKTKGSV